MYDWKKNVIQEPEVPVSATPVERLSDPVAFPPLPTDIAGNATNIINSSVQSPINHVQNDPVLPNRMNIPTVIPTNNITSVPTMPQQGYVNQQAYQQAQPTHTGFFTPNQPLLNPNGAPPSNTYMNSTQPHIPSEAPPSYPHMNSTQHHIPSGFNLGGITYNVPVSNPFDPLSSHA